MNPEEQKALLESLVGTVRASSALAAQDIEFYKSLDKNVSDSVSQLTTDVIDMINSVLSSIDEHFEPLDSEKGSFNDSWKDVTNLIDNLFEKSDRSLDILTRGLNSAKSTGSNIQYLDEFGGNDTNGNVRVEKPQLNFSTPVDNSESHPFHPLLKEKPNALKPFEESLVLVPEEENIPSHYLQPYEYEIDHQEYNENVLQIKDPISSTVWSETEAIWVDNVESLNKMITELKNFSELAIDLEHHDYRSYYGIVSLMQISTREKDYLIDTINLRDELHVLNGIFTNPMVVKVLHGAFMDIIWLQRDLGLYIVGLFDTFHASRALGLPRHSLAFLLEKYANFKTSKKYQLADWRIRPLSKAMTAYARADTHFLLNIYDQLRNKLVESNKLAGVLNESRNVAKRRFEYSKYRPKVFSPTVYSPIEKEDPWKSLMFQYNIPLEKEELLKELFNWRDLIARRDDESPRYVMPNQLIVSLVAYSPIDPVGVVSVSNMVTDYVRSNSKIIANLIKTCLTNMKETGNKVNLSSKDSEEDVIDDLINKISVPQIKNIGNNFSKLVGSHNSNFDTKDKLADGELELSIFFGNLKNNDKIIKYTNNESKKEVGKEQLELRASDYIKHLEALDDIEYEVPVIKQVLPEIVPEEENNKESIILVEANESKNKIKPAEDLDEIIVLKRVNRGGSKRQRNDKTSSTSDVIDYSKATKVLNNDKKKNKGYNKRKFDPFSSIQEGPRAPKKRKAGTRGKNMSFKR